MFSSKNKACVSEHKHFNHNNTFNEHMLHKIEYLLNEQNHLFKGPILRLL